jgi:hypothetical protein
MKGTNDGGRWGILSNWRSGVVRTCIACWLIAGAPAIAESPVQLKINTRVLPLGADLRVIVNIPRDADNRALTIEADSEDYLRSSTIPLDGDLEAYTHQFWFTHLPIGQYEVVAKVVGTRGVRGTDTLVVTVVGASRR